MDCFYTAKVFLLKLNIEHDALLNTVLVAFKQRRCFSLRGLPARIHQGVGRFQTAKVFLPACAGDGFIFFKVLVAFKQRRCFSQRGRIRGGYAVRCWSLSNSEGVSPKVGNRWQKINSVVLVAFKQRRCFSQMAATHAKIDRCWSLSNSEGVSPGGGDEYKIEKGVGRFQTAKVFLHSRYS